MSNDAQNSTLTMAKIKETYEILKKQKPVFLEDVIKQALKEDLLPCPFCNADAELESVDFGHSETYYVRCNCGASMYLDSKEKLLESWNRRKCTILNIEAEAWNRMAA